MQERHSKALDFLLVGAPRSGTTSLFQQLRGHPEIFIPSAKELPYFSDEERFAAGWPSFVGSFFAGASPALRWGKLTPHYWDSAPVPARVRAAMPEVKLLALLRNPIDRALSHYRFLVRRGVEPLSFGEVIFNADTLKHRHYLPAGEYGRIVADYRGHFGAEQLLVLFTEEMESDPECVLASVLRYLDVDLDYRPRNLDQRFNEGGTETRFAGLVPFLRRQRPIRGLWRRLPERLRRAIGHWYFFEVAPRPSPPPPLAPELRARLREHYRPDVAELERLIGRQVPWPELRG